MEDYSVFDIIGPRMTGPSSSHTAGAVRLAHIARQIAGQDVAQAAFTLYGSFAETGKGHGTDKALVAGVLGMEPDDVRIKEAYAVAREMGVGFRATSGPVIAKSGDLAALLTNLEDGDVLFIDEIHRLQPAVEEVLYPAMEDRALDLMIVIRTYIGHLQIQTGGNAE